MQAGRRLLFSWSVRSMQAGREFAKPFPKLPYMHGEEGFLPSCLLNYWMGVLNVFAKIKDANSICQTVGDALMKQTEK